jgi:U32 family peptidase
MFASCGMGTLLTVPTPETSPVLSGDAPRLTAARPPELLAPAGDWDCVRAAVENGADAIYFGLDQFNARMRARNFTEADLPELLAFLHRRGVRGYVTFNTLVFPNEMVRAERFARAVIAAGTDAAIVQDVGICRLIRSLSPDFPLHASTQMTITSPAGVEFARGLGCQLVVLAREVPVREIATLQAATAGEVALETFVHGALCVAYSGQCLTSESLGGRSANRGVCAQACRMPYALIADGQSVDLGDRSYLLSPRDLVGIEALPELIRAGVASLKIEGRLKTPEYVANVTRAYRQALDEVWAALNGSLGDAARARREAASVAQTALAARRYDLEMAFSRGLAPGWLEGVNNQELVHGRFGKKRGVFLGRVTAVRPHHIHLHLEGPVKPGDGVVFDAGRPDQEEEGGRIHEVVSRPGHSEVVLRFGRGDINSRRIQVGDRVWKTSDPDLDRRLRQTYSGDQPRHLRPLDLEVHGQAGQVLTLLARDEQGHAVRVESRLPLAPAEHRPLTLAVLRQQLGRLGGTPFQLGTLDSHLAGEVMLPVSELNRLRRETVQKLETLRGQPPRWTLNRTETPPAERVSAAPGDRPAELSVLVRELDQLDAVLATEVRTVYCDFDNPKTYREAVSRFRSRPAANRHPEAAIFVAPPRVARAGEEWILRQVRASEADGYLVRNYDQLEFFQGVRRAGDYSLNVANRWSAEYFLQRYHLEWLTASYDLNHVELAALLQSAPPAWFEITLHQHMPMFHMEHCVFCAFLSSGTDYTNCGRPCDRHTVHLRDRVGARHPVHADAGCRNTVFNALAQTGAEHAAAFLALGARRFRLEFLDESPDAVLGTVQRYGQLLRGEISGTQLWRDLQLSNQLGVTRGPPV